MRSLFALLLVALALPASAQLQSPEEFLGRPVGEDRHLFDWDSIVSYLHHVDSQSDRVEVEELGRTTEGRPFLLVKIADAEGLAQQSRWRETTAALYEARVTDEPRARALAAEGRAVLAFSLGVHSTEVGASQASMEMVYRLATAEDPITRRVRERLMILLVPSMNPDGLELVRDWYMQTVGTEAEGTRPLELYHPYAGHDNNRDGFFHNLVETSMWSRMLYHTWRPQVIVDEHQMGSDGPRLFLPPFDDPVSPTVHPLVYSQLAAAGQQTVSDLTAMGHEGIATSTIFTAEWPGSVRSTGFWHNMLGILSEVASARLATPLYFPPGSLGARGRGLPEYERRANFLAPWEGGWWRLRDIVDIEIDLTWALLRWASERKEDLLFHFWQMNRDAIEAGSREAPYAFVIPETQSGPTSAQRLAEILHLGGVELHWSEGPLDFGNRRVRDGAWVVRCDQPYRPFVLEMLGATSYPVLREGGVDGEVVRPYDVTAWRLPDLLGVEVLAVEDSSALEGFLLEPRQPSVLTPPATLPATDAAASGARVAIYSPWGGSMDEGWTRLVLDRNGIAHRRMRPGDALLDGEQAGRRARRSTDVVILPSISSQTLSRGVQPVGDARVHEALWPARYRGGIGDMAGASLRAFVEAGGTLVALNHSVPWAIESLGLPIAVELDGVDRDDFYAPGTLVRGLVDVDHPLARGMGREASLYFAGGYALRPLAWPRATEVVVRYAESADLHVAGFLTGAERLAGRPAMVEIPVGEGRVVLFGFTPQRRAQTEGTFPLFLNCLSAAASPR